MTVKKLNDVLQTKIKAQVNPEPSTYFIWGSQDGNASKKHNWLWSCRYRDFIFQTGIDQGNQIPSRTVSPNALFRPIYQELILPNLVTVGGGSGNWAYWLQLSAVFASFDCPCHAQTAIFGFVDQRQAATKDRQTGYFDCRFVFTNQRVDQPSGSSNQQYRYDLGEFKAHLDQQFDALYACKTN